MAQVHTFAENVDNAKAGCMDFISNNKSTELISQITKHLLNAEAVQVSCANPNSDFDFNIVAPTGIEPVSKV